MSSPPTSSDNILMKRPSELNIIKFYDKFQTISNVLGSEEAAYALVVRAQKDYDNDCVKQILHNVPDKGRCPICRSNVVAVHYEWLVDRTEHLADANPPIDNSDDEVEVIVLSAEENQKRVSSLRAAFDKRLEVLQNQGNGIDNPIVID
ncbi:hypothetical protein VNI00_010292 [Paramarasmius palmivorus]|uniref:Uncharacterized protein n=1 Tax=Paramarasmius palmivorus TaxID=297713 RepID=A0AAW0CIU0_9AGAR